MSRLHSTSGLLPSAAAAALVAALGASPASGARSADLVATVPSATMATAGLHGTTQLAADTLTDLRTLLDTGVALQDRNGDGVVDFVAARILVAPDATESEVVAAANVAARLGYETSAADLDLLGRAGDGASHTDPVVLVGAGAVDAAGVPGGSADLTRGLAPGEGTLARIPPSGTLEVGGVAAVGYDATGLLAVAGYLSGRYPAVWEVDGTSWHEAGAEVEDFLEAHDLADAVVTLDRVVVSAADPGVVRAVVTVRVADAPTFERAVRAFLDGDTTATGADLPTDTAEVAPSPTDLVPRDVRRLDVRIVGPEASRTVPLLPPEPWETGGDAEFRPGDDADVSLAEIYSVGGLYRDTNRDLVPDETAGYLSVSGADAAESVVELATRIGLETAGIRLPLVRVAGQEDDPEALGFPILVGTDHYGIRRLTEEGELVGGAVAGPPAPEGDAVGADPGEGFVQLVDAAFGRGEADERRNGMVVGGGDAAGLEAALVWLARRAPYLWTHGKGEYRLADAATDVRRFFQVREGPGQLALGLTKLGTWMDRMAEAGESPARVEVELAALEAPEGLAGVAETVVRERFPDADVSVSTWPTGFGVGDTVFVQEWELPWEVDEVRELLEQEVYPAADAGGAPLRVEVRVSEPPEVRTALADEIRAELRDRGASDPEVVVLNAYKQGYSWVTDHVLPRLRGTPVAAIDITYHTLEESDEVRWQTIAAETRWLQELFPVDAVLARELAIPDSAVTFRPTRRSDPVYTLEARDTAGDLVLAESFTPKYVVRPFFDLFPEYEQVRVTTGWITVTRGAGTGGGGIGDGGGAPSRTATAGTDTLVDQRVVTDPERFWDRFQTETYGEIVEYVMDTQEGDPSPDNAPYFDELAVDLRLSEANHRIGVDEEVISSLEALHEDIYFETLTLFDLIGSRWQTSLPYPGRVLPYIDPTGAGEPGRARISFTGKERATPGLRVRTWSSGEGAEPRLREYGLSTLPAGEPKVAGVTVAAGEEGLRRLLVRVEAADSVDRYPEFRERSSEAGIDRQFLSVELLADMLDALRRLHDAGLVEDALSWDRVEELAVDFRVEDDTLFQRTAVLPRSRSPASTDNPRLFAEGWTHGGERLVQWETPIPPAENDSVLAKLATFPGVNVYYLTDSFLGQPVWAADFLPPQEAGYVSQAKLNALKPTLFISGRQHANEVSSTSHMLRLGELLVTDSSYRALLDEVNVVLHPVTNPDGARLAVEMQETNPDFMLHAGYLGALGVDATSGERSDDPVYPESQARRRIREAWLPDIYINMHGYPSHEWVQYFAGYSAWVRSRRGGQRSWWAPRGWFIPGMGWSDDEENPEYREAQFAVLDSVAAAITAEPEVEAMNRRMYARYRKYGEQDRDDFREYFHEGILVNLSLRGSESIGTGLYSDRITWFSTTTEAPDETARGDWLELVATAGLAHSSALLRYLAKGTYDVEREADAFEGAVTRKVYRVKPVLPKGGDGEGRDGDGGE